MFARRVNPGVLYIGHPVYFDSRDNSTNSERVEAIYITKGSFRNTFHEHTMLIIIWTRGKPSLKYGFCFIFSYQDVSQKVSSGSRIN